MRSSEDTGKTTEITEIPGKEPPVRLDVPGGDFEIMRTALWTL